MSPNLHPSFQSIHSLSLLATKQKHFLFPLLTPITEVRMSHRRRHRAPQPRVEVITPAGEDAPSLTVTMLGAGQEVGRSCCVIQHRGRTVVCDAGLHPAYPGLGGLPFIDELDWSTVDAILVTQ